jgi:hypothetical protein
LLSVFFIFFHFTFLEESGMNRFSMFCVMALLAASGLCSSAFAQDENRGRGGQRGDFDPARFREMRLNFYKERLGTSDDEWKVLVPKIEKVMTVQAESSAGFGGFGGGRGGRGGGGGGGGGGDRPQTALGKASADLRSALEASDTSTEEITKRLTALREVRAKAREDLAAAQKELKEVLTGKQEAQMVVLGLLE